MLRNFLYLNSVYIPSKSSVKYAKAIADLVVIIEIPK